MTTSLIWTTRVPNKKINMIWNETLNICTYIYLEPWYNSSFAVAVAAGNSLPTFHTAVSRNHGTHYCDSWMHNRLHTYCKHPFFLPFSWFLLRLSVCCFRCRRWPTASLLYTLAAHNKYNLIKMARRTTNVLYLFSIHCNTIANKNIRRIFTFSRATSRPFSSLFLLCSLHLGPNANDNMQTRARIRSLCVFFWRLRL